MSEIIFFFKNLDFNLSGVESIAVCFSIIYVILAARENIWCWLSAAISVSIYTYICFNSKLYAETGLQLFYLIMALYGYYNWSNKNQSVKIKEWSMYTHLLIIILGGILTFLMGFYFATYTDAKMPILDSFTTVFSIFATYMITKKIVGNWLYWIVINIVSVYLYFYRDLNLTALLFVAYTVIAVFGYLNWLKILQKND